MAAKKAPPKRRAPRRKKVELASKGLSPQEVAQAEPAGKKLAEEISADGGAPLAVFRDPVGGHSVVLAALPMDKVEPTPYQRDRSETHVKKLANAMERVGRYLDPIICVRHDGSYWTPNGNHRLGAMKLLGMKTIVGLVLPEPETAFQILALNTEKAHNLKERSLEVIRMYRGLVGARGKELETAFAGHFEEPHFITFGLCYEKKPRYAAGAYASPVKRLESFLEESLVDGLAEREHRAALLLEWDEAVGKVVEALKAKGFDSPYLKNYVVARVNFLRWDKKPTELDFEDTLNKLIAATRKVDPGKVNREDLSKMAGAPAEPTDD